MSALREVYRHSPALLTDLYELTMFHGHWRLGRAVTRDMRAAGARVLRPGDLLG